MREPIGVGILGIGAALPPTVRKNDFWPKSFNPNGEEERRRTIIAVERAADGARSELPAEIAQAMAALGDDPFRGARTRRVIDDDVDASDLEAEAARRAIRAAGLLPTDIDVVIAHSLVPDRLMPSNGPAVQAKCELTNAAAWNIDASCATFQIQLVIAAGLVRSGMARHVLLVQSLVMSRVLDYSTPISTIFGDAATAVVVGELPAGYGLIGQWIRTDGSLREGVVLAPVVNGAPQKDWTGCAGPIQMTSFDLETGKQAGLRSTEFCREACAGALEAAGVRMADVALYVGAQSTGWLVDACRRKLGLSASQVVDTFAEVANIGSATVPFNLLRAHDDRRLRDGDLVLAYSPGAGLTRAAVVYRWLAPR